MQGKHKLSIQRGDEENARVRETEVEHTSLIPFCGLHHLTTHGLHAGREQAHIAQDANLNPVAVDHGSFLGSKHRVSHLKPCVSHLKP